MDDAEFYAGLDRLGRFFEDWELSQGVETEMEHTNDRDVARRIALDHLREDPHYYKKLQKTDLHAMADEVNRFLMPAAAPNPAKGLQGGFSSSKHPRGEGGQFQTSGKTAEKKAEDVGGEPEAPSQAEELLMALNPQSREFVMVLVPMVLQLMGRQGDGQGSNHAPADGAV